ncbi:MAG: 23S rRNA (pseudouridine(1915)-N(3))-methyltransferase RlmH [Paracoccaceae bacterium]
MRISICALGRLRAGAERDLVKDYLTRFNRTGRALSLGPATVIEVHDKSGGGIAREAGLLRKSCPEGALICALDERAPVISSPEFAALLVRWRDAGQSDIAFMIGGADGLHAELRNAAEASLSLGPMVWPHMLVRVMLAEQLYRAASILTNSPYHRA